jgi:hypothetical protein
MLVRFLFLGLFTICVPAPSYSQELLKLNLIKDEFCQYVDLNTENIIQLLATSDDEFVHFMQENHFRKAELGRNNEFIAPSTKLNHARLLFKKNHEIVFTFSPETQNLVHNFLTDLKTHSQLKSNSTKGNVQSLYVKFPQLAVKQNYQITLTEKIDSEEYVGRTIEVKTLIVTIKRR